MKGIALAAPNLPATDVANCCNQYVAILYILLGGYPDRLSACLDYRLLLQDGI
jgi:hypothetical protein